MDSIAMLAHDLFPPSTPTPSSAADDDDDAALDGVLRRLLSRRHAPLAWPAHDARDDTAADGDVPAPPLGDPTLRIPREYDRAALLQTIAIKDAQVKQLEGVLLVPPADPSATIGLSRRTQALVANARRREAVMSCKLKALSREVHGYRQRELAAARINRALRRQLRDALNDLDAIALRREVRTLRADLSAALAREAALQRELLNASLVHEADRFALSQSHEDKRRLRNDMDYVRQVAVASMAARAADAGVEVH